MGRRRKAWLWGGDGIRRDGGRRLPGRYVRWHEYDGDRRVSRSRCFTGGADRDNLRRAREWVRQFNARHDLRAVGEIVAIPYREAVAEFMVSCAALATDTRIHYASGLGMLAAVLDADTLVCNVGPRDIGSFVASRVRKGNSPATVAKHLRSLAAFFNWCVDAGYAESNPTAKVRAKRGTFRRSRPPVSDAQLSVLLRSLDTEDRHVAVVIGMTVGFDRGVIERLHAGQVDLDGRCFRIRRPKTGKDVVAPIHPSILPVLAERLRRTPPSRPLLSGLSRQHRRRDWWKQAAAAAGVPDLWFRDLRAVAVSRLRRLGVSERDVAHLLSHSYAQTTAEHYHTPDEKVVTAFQRLPIPGFQTPAEQTTA